MISMRAEEFERVLNLLSVNRKKTNNKEDEHTLDGDEQVLPIIFDFN
jgi:hypothetical protein